MRDLEREGTTMTDADNLRVNLAALQRVDPYISQIVDTASQVALYKYDGYRGEWDRTDIEGALFIYARSAPPFNGFIIMNRLNTTNQIEPLTKDLEFKKEFPYLLYKNAKLSIYGIWFYEGKDYGRISDRLISLLGEANRKPSAQRQRRASESDSKTDDNSVDILSMLSRAQERFAKGSGNGNLDFDRSPAEPRNMVDNLRNGDVIRPKAVKAPNQGPANSKQPFVFGGGGASGNTVASLFASAQAQFQRKPKSGPPPLPFARPIEGLPRDPPNPKREERALEEAGRTNVPLTARRRLSVDEILTPAMIELGNRPFASPTPDCAVSSLMSPMMFVTPSKGEISQGPRTEQGLNPLTKEQLVQSLVYLLKNDDDFVVRLHQAYVSSLLAATTPKH